MGLVDVCLNCKEPPEQCDCTGGPLLEPECSCYEPAYGHQPGCAFYGRGQTAPESRTAVAGRHGFHVDLWDAYLAGSRDGQLFPGAAEADLRLGADGYVKLWQEQNQ